MKQTEIEVGKVYTNITSENRRVLAINKGADGVAIVRFQAMPWTMDPDHYLRHYKHLAALPSPAEFRNKTRVAPGVLYAEIPLAASLGGPNRNVNRTPSSASLDALWPTK